MNRKLLSILLALILVFSAVIGAACATEETEMNTVSVSGEDFEYTLQTKALEFDAARLSPDAPFDVTLSIEYTGDQESVDLWCVDDLGTISMEDENGKALLSDEFHSRATSRVTLKRENLTSSGGPEPRSTKSMTASPPETTKWSPTSTSPPTRTTSPSRKTRWT